MTIFHSITIAQVRCGIAIIALLFASSPVLAATLAAGFEQTVIAGPIYAGTSLEFAPDGKLFVLEKSGTIQVYQRTGPTNWIQVAPLNNFLSSDPPKVYALGESGLLGIAFDPAYVTNRYVYLHYVGDSPRRNRISRITANADGTQAIAGSEAVIMELDETLGSNHKGGDLHFGPDGKLYASIGDHNQPSASQSIISRFGKILRLNPDPGNPIPDDNPTSISGIAGTPVGVNRSIWAAGLRNPFKFAFKPGTNLMFINDVGDDDWEEINSGAAGANYRWPWEGPFNQKQYPQFAPPIVYYNHWNGWESFPPEYGFIGYCITGGAFYVPPVTMFPADYIGDYFFTDVLGGWIRRYDPATKKVQTIATGAGFPVDVRIGPDGALYYLQHNTKGYVVCIKYLAVCAADVQPTGGNGSVDVGDILTIINNWGSCSPECIWPCPADANGDCTLNVSDLLAVINAWGDCP